MKDNPCQQKIESKKLFLIGTGFSKAVFDDVPLNDELLERMIAKKSKPLSKYTKKYSVKDIIELLLTYLDLDIIKNPHEKSLDDDRKIINRQIAEFFQQFRIKKRLNKEKEWWKTFSQDILQENDSVVTLNYDCILEGMLDHYNVWSPKNGYGPIKYPVDSDLRKNPKGINIYKVHGSEHFIKGSPIGSGNTFVSHEINECTFPNSGKNKNFFVGNSLGPYIIPPSYVKIPHLYISIAMNEALYKAKSSNTMIIMGCGMRPEDSFLQLLTGAFVYSPQKLKKKIIIVDINASDIKNKVKSYFDEYIEPENIISIEEGIENSMEELKMNIMEGDQL